MSPALHPTGPSAPPTTLLAAFLWREPGALRARAAGQGLVEYGLILVLIAIVTIGVVTALGRRTSQVFERVNCTVSSGASHTDHGNGNSNRCL